MQGDRACGGGRRDPQRGDTILSADDKAGVAAIFEGVRSLIEAGEALPDVYVVLTTCEEMHLLGAGALDASFLSEGTPSM